MINYQGLGADQSKSATPLAAGWYMLTVSSSTAQMGSSVELHLGEHMASLQLGVSSLSRRIVYNANRVEGVPVSLNEDESAQGLVNVSLSRVTRQFAQSRMDRKCRQAVNYDTYDEFMRAYRDGPNYQRWLSQHPDRGVGALLGVADIKHTNAVVVTDDAISLHDEATAIFKSQLEAKPQIKLCYCDHEIVDADGKVLHGVMKPSWDITLLRSGNYIGRVFACTQSLYDELGGLDDTLGHAKEYDFLLRASRVLTKDEILRVPAVLYSVEASQNSDRWFHVNENDRKALEKYWQAMVSDPTVRPRVTDATVPGLFRTQWPLPEPAPSVDIIIPTRDREPVLRACVDSILQLTDYPNYHIRIVDNDSSDPAFFSYLKSLQDDARVSFMPFPGDFNYSAINNAAVRESSADIVVLLNNDTEVIDGHWLTELTALAHQTEHGCVGARLLYANSRVQHAGIVMGMKGLAGHVNRFASDQDTGYLHKLRLAHQCSAVTAACLAIRRDVFISCGGFDETDLKVAFNDVDLCLRVAAANYRNILAPYVTLLHHESVSRGADDSSEKAARFKSECNTLLERWPALVSDDPYWNPNLSLDSEKPVYAT